MLHKTQSQIFKNPYGFGGDWVKKQSMTFQQAKTGEVGSLLIFQQICLCFGGETVNAPP